jgi:hypothetical protein
MVFTMDDELETLIASMGGRSADERAAEEEPSQPVSVRSSTTDSDVTAAIATFVQWARDSEKVSPAPILRRGRPCDKL